LSKVGIVPAALDYRRGPINPADIVHATSTAPRVA
jgi:hypothetical protein